MKKFIKFASGFIALSLMMVLVGIGFYKSEQKRGEASAVSLTKTETAPAVVLDPGHGGEDGGCSSLDGTLEKDLNLSVSRVLYDILNVSGIKTVLTRDDDSMLYDRFGDLSDYTGKKKTYDLKNRLRLASDSECRLFLSIHMNKFSEEKYSGLQVYYSPNDSDSITAALRIQKYAKEYNAPENDREIKKAGSEIYILNRAEMPAVLVECGFLSNPSDLEKLRTDAYQKELSLAIGAAVADSLANFETYLK